MSTVTQHATSTEQRKKVKLLSHPIHSLIHTRKVDALLYIHITDDVPAILHARRILLHVYQAVSLLCP